MLSLEQSEKEKYEKVWNFPQYRNHSPGERHVKTAINAMQIKPGSDLIDFGCGTGRPAQMFKNMGITVLGIDFAANCLDPDVDIHFMISNLWEIPTCVVSDYGFCTDVMEHIPPEKVDEVLHRIWNACEKACYFNIACFKDGFGRLVGKPLHLTVQSPDWWKSKLEAHWEGVDVIHNGPREFTAVCYA